MDFALVLLLILIATGAIWALDHWLWAPGRRRATEALRAAGSPKEAVRQAAKEPLVVEYARAFFPVILIVFALRSFVVEPFRIPSGSMLPSLLIGDFILVNKFAYGIRLPVVNKRIVGAGAPKRGEVAVFRFPGDPSINYIKRIIGLPGDHVVYRGKRLYVNGKLMEQAPLGAYRLANAEAAGEALRLSEQVDGIQHDILTTDRPEYGLSEFRVPPGHYFAMGDNRDHSNDSRYWGFVPDENLVGRAFMIWFSCDMSHPGLFFCGRVFWDRIGDGIQ